MKRNILTILLFMDSRKVGLAVWVFLVSSAYLGIKWISVSDWLTCVLAAVGLVGGGTWLDKRQELRKQEMEEVVRQTSARERSD